MKEDAALVFFLISMLGTIASYQRRQRSAVLVVRTLFLAVVWAASWGGSYFLASLAAGPRDPHHGVMPLGQVFFAWGASLILLTLFAYFYVRRGEPNPRLEAWVARGACLFFLGLLLFQSRG